MAAYIGSIHVLLLTFVGVSLAKTYLQTNEIVQAPNDLSSGLPVCPSGSVCGFLQANIQGINVQRRCGCPLPQRCPLTWDSADGHTVVQGSEQYKFCGPVQKLSACELGKVAYTSRMVFSKITDEVVTKGDFVHCICPEGYNHVLQDQEFRDDSPELESMHLTYTCAPLKECQPGEFCKHVTETSTEFLVNQKCTCPQGLRCPSTSFMNVRGEPYGNGMVYQLRCRR